MNKNFELNVPLKFWWDQHIRARAEHESCPSWMGTDIF